MDNIFRKLTAQDVEARVQSVDKNGIVLLIYKNARVDQNILDETVGAMNWQNKFYECKGNLYCSLGINANYKNADEPRWIWKDDCGTESKTEAEKGEASDARKRAGFAWGIGRELYTSPKIKIKGHTKVKDNKYYSEYYEFNVALLEVSDTRKITALTITGKSIDGGFHEDIVFDWKDGNQATPKNTPKKAETTTTQTNTQPTTKNANIITYNKELCTKCNSEVTETVAKFSKDKFGKVLCFKCQQEDDGLPF